MELSTQQMTKQQGLKNTEDKIIRLVGGYGKSEM